MGNANEDKPPTVTFTSPAANATKVSANKGTTLAATATDDKGVAKVQFLDDERVVCEDTAAPYTCAYKPGGGDVGATRSRPWRSIRRSRRRRRGGRSWSTASRRAS